MRLNIRRALIFILASALVSLVLTPLRHPFFNRIDFNSIVVVLQTIAYVSLTGHENRRLNIYWTGAFALLGFAISGVAFAFTSIFLDKFGINGLKISIAHSGLPNYVLNTFFLAFFSYCWVQLPLSIAIETYARRRLHSKKLLGETQ